MSEKESDENTLRDVNNLEWTVDDSDKSECIECGGQAAQITNLESDRYLCYDCGLVWNPHQINKGESV